MLSLPDSTTGEVVKTKILIKDWIGTKEDNINSFGIIFANYSS